MNSSTPYFLLLTLCLILISQFPWPINGRTIHDHGHGHDRDHDGDVPDLIKLVCKNVDDAPKECTTVLRQNERAVHAHDFVELSIAILEMAVNQSKESQGHFKELLKAKKVAAIEECAKHDYGEVIELFEKARDEVQLNPADAGYDALSAREGNKACDTALNAAHVNTPQLNALNHRTWLFSEIAFIATDQH